MTWETLWPAPAKLNLFLHVVGRREDGYHLLQSVFCFIDLCDRLRFEPRDDGRIVLATPTPGVAPEQDLVVRAAERLKVGAGDTAADCGATIHLEKHIPMGGGLGGGSSDAATTLLALNHLWGLGLPRNRLESIGLDLGADVPVFVHGCNTFAEGVGEKFTDAAVPVRWYLLTRPKVHVPTPEIFRSPSLRRDSPAIHPSEWRPGFGGNDLEPVACTLFPEVEQHLAVLKRFGDARMTGSGACCFVAFDSEAAARAVMAELPADMGAQVIPGLSQHPLRSLT